MNQIGSLKLWLDNQARHNLTTPSDHLHLSPLVLNVNEWESRLSAGQYPNKTYILEAIRDGVNINFVHSTPLTSVRLCPNLIGARPELANHDPQVSLKILEDLKKETELGRRAGPFSSPPFGNLQCSPIGAVPKKKSTKLRLVHHLSWPRDTSETSINSQIDDIDCEYLKFHEICYRQSTSRCAPSEV